MTTSAESADGGKGEAAAKVRQRLDPEHLDDLKASGLTDEQILACGFCSLEPTRVGRHLRQSEYWAAARGRCLAIPYYGLDGNLVLCLDRDTGTPLLGKDGKEFVYVRCKPNKPNRVSESRKYEACRGARNRAYFPPATRTKLNDPAHSIIVVEGEKKAARADQDGFVCIGISGVECWSARRLNGPDGKKIGERKLMDDLAAIEWRDRKVYICFDSDIREKRGVQWAEYALANALHKLGAKVRVVRLPDLPDDKKCGLDDFLVSHGKDAFEDRLATALRPCRPGRKRKGRVPAVDVDDVTPAPARADRPIVEHSKMQYDEVDAAALTALVEQNKPPYIFVGNGGALSQVYRPVLGESVGIRRFDAASLRLVFGSIITWRRGTEHEVYADFPPHALLTSFPARGEWPGIPHLRALISYPAFGPGWQRVAAQGYHAGTGIFCDLNGLVVPPVAEKPMQGDLEEAKRLLLGELLIDFPFVDDASLANALAMLILPVIRNAIDGPTPLGVIDAPTEGTGKSLLAELIALLTTGAIPEAISPDVGDEEWNKSLLAMLMAGKPITYLDNANHKLESGALASALTAEWKEGRILGETRMARARVNTCWYLTANNFRCSREIGRRCYWTRIDAGVETPSQRTEFKHPDLMGWARANRPRLLWAVLTLVQNWLARGSAPGAATLGKFERWAGAMSGILDAAGIEDFLANGAEFRQRCPDQVGEATEFIELWHNTYPDAPKTAGELFPLARQTLDSVLSAENDDGRRKQLGRFLVQYRDRVVGKFQIVVANTDKSRPRYRLVAVAENPPKKVLKARAALDNGDEVELSA